jgi:endonuclease YncB( thermonuclease family)
LRLLALASAIACPMVQASSQPRPSITDACRLQSTGSGKVDIIVDGRSFTLEDGRHVRLPGIEVPLLPRPGEQDMRAAAALAAREALAVILAGQEVELRQSTAVVDRYGRMLAHAYLQRSGSQQSAAHAMVAAGMARVSGADGNRACVTELLVAERNARAAKLGLWSEPYYAILAAENLAELVAERGRFIIVEGKVLSVRESGGTIFMNFGRRWSQALTVTILKRNERHFVSAGMEPKRLENRLLRIRGWVEERNGPRIEASHPEQIEIAER